VKRSPLSFAQARIWLLNQITGPDAQYNVPLVARCRDEVDAEALRAALQDVVLRHEILRTVYELVDGEPVQSVRSPQAGHDLLSVERLPESSRPARISELWSYEFDLETETSVRAWLLSSDSADDVLVIMLHHIATDGSSLAPLLRDLGTAYVARQHRAEPDWDSPPVQYSQYASWQRDFLGDSADPHSLAGRQLAYWRAKLAELPVEIGLPTDRQRPRMASTDGAIVAMTMPADLCRRVVALSRAERVTPFTVFKTALAAFLGRLGAGADIPLGGFVSGRADAALDDTVGFFVNTLVFRVDTSGDPAFLELLRRVRTTELEAYSHQDLPFDLIVKELQPPRSSSRHPLTQTAISYEDPVAYRIPGLDAEVEAGENLRAKFDLHLYIVVDRDSDGEPTAMQLSWRYATTLFDAPTIESVAARFIGFLESAVTQADRNIESLPA
jgi:hypothetical protein